jgi:Flp pilus assembly protein TadD
MPPTPEIEFDAELVRELTRVGDEFLVRCLRYETSIRPANLGALAELGHALTRLERYREGLEIDRTLVKLCPADPLVHYNLACSLALLAECDEAFAELERAIELGYCEPQHLLDDPDFANLRADPRFQRLVDRIRGGR